MVPPSLSFTHLQQNPFPGCAQRHPLHPAPVTRGDNSGGERGREEKEQRALINSSKSMPSALSDRTEGFGHWALSCTSLVSGFDDDFCPTGSPEDLKAEFAELVSELWLGAFLLIAIWGQLTWEWVLPG